MKKLIASAALVTTLIGTGTAALAETTVNVTTPVATATADTTAVQTTATTDTTATADTTAVQTTATTDTATDAEIATTTAVDLPAVTLTPDKLFYGLKLWVENIRIAITRDALEKAALLEGQAQTRLAEAKAMAEAGKMDLAQVALNEARAKLAEAEKTMAAATEANKDMSTLAAKVEADQTTFAVVLSDMLAKAPEDVKAQMEPVIAEVLIQLAATTDTATQDETAKDEADKVAAEANLEEQLAGLQPRMILVLSAMSQASGKTLEEVLDMYKANPGLGRIAKELGLKMGPVQHAAQVEWKQKGSKIEIEITTADGEAKLELEAGGVEVKSETATTKATKAVKVELKRSDRDSDDRDDEADDDDKSGKEEKRKESKENPGQAKGKDKDKK